jgi:peptidoglycan LD-endopeptidase LytH
MARALTGRLLSAAFVASVSVAAVWQAAAQTLPALRSAPAVAPRTLAAAPAPALKALAVLPKAFAAPPAPKLVWEGRDIDGDGASDFANPTGLAPRSHDAFGAGHFGASRDGGSREHAGVDYEAEAGQAVLAPMSGFVTRIGQAYGDDAAFKYVEISNPALRHTARVFYLDPDVSVGQPVRLGAPIGRVLSLQDRYPGITDHVHLEIAGAAGRRDPGEVIIARLDRNRRG